MEETRKDKLQLLIRRIFLIITDILLINGAVYLSLIMRFNVEISSIEEQYIRNYEKGCYTIYDYYTCYILVFRMYHSLWQYASIAELYKIVEACIVAELMHLALTAFMEWMSPMFLLFYVWNIF